MDAYEKKYKEVLERAREFVCKDNVEVAEYIFPELSGSEDEKPNSERIRKAIICGMNALKGQKIETFSTIPIDDCIAWLEKQGEPKLLNNEEYQTVPTEIPDRLYASKKELEKPKQYEQKPTDKVEPKFKVGDVVTNKKSKDTVKIVQILHDSYCYSGWDGAATVHSDFSISEQDDWELVELTAWSEEGGQKYSKDSYKKSDDIAAEEKAEYKKGFDCGKQLVLKYPEDFDLCKKTLTDWCKEDEEMMSSTVFYLNGYREVYQEGAQKCISWLKSLKNKCTWKPSDEQIEALESATENCAYSEYQDCLRELIGQLKKLKGE